MIRQGKYVVKNYDELILSNEEYYTYNQGIRYKVATVDQKGVKDEIARAPAPNEQGELLVVGDVAKKVKDTDSDGIADKSDEEQIKSTIRRCQNPQKLQRNRFLLS